MWALRNDGQVIRLSPRTGAKPQLWAKFVSDRTALNRFALADVRSRAIPLRGSFLLALDSMCVRSMSLVATSVAEVARLAHPKKILAADAVEDSSSYFGMAAQSDLYFFFSVSADGEISLVTRSLDPDHATLEQPPLAGRSAMGPVTKGTWVAVCDGSEIRMFNTAEPKILSFVLPEEFHPYLRRPSRRVRVPIGHTPFVISKTEAGWDAWIAGEQRSAAGVLQATMESNYYDFHPVLPESTISEVVPGRLSFVTESGVQFSDPHPGIGRISNLRADMPILADDGSTFYFRATASDSLHNLTMMSAGGEPIGLSFEDAQCNKDTCCAAYRIGDDILVCYFYGAGTQTGGMRFAHWTVQ